MPSKRKNTKDLYVDPQYAIHTPEEIEERRWAWNFRKIRFQKKKNNGVND